MDNYLFMLFFIFIGSFVGWVTNKIAVLLLFKPYEPKNILLFSFQGVIPKRKREMAKSIASQIEKELFSAEDISGLLSSEKETIKRKAIDNITRAVVRSVYPSAGIFMSKFINESIEKIVKENGDEVIEDFIDSFCRDCTVNNQISSVIEQKINDYPMEKIEYLTYAIMSKELKHIEHLGAFLGALIGFIQSIIIGFI